MFGIVGYPCPTGSWKFKLGNLVKEGKLCTGPAKEENPLEQLYKCEILVNIFIYLLTDGVTHKWWDPPDVSGADSTIYKAQKGLLPFISVLC